MKPTQEKILSSIQENKSKKELLSVQKVELGVKDLTTLLKKANEAKKEVKKYMKDAKETESSFNNLQKELKQLEVKKDDLKDKNSDIYDKNLKEFNVLEKAAKELGVDITDIPAYKDYGKTVDIILQNRKDIDAAWSDIYKFKP